MSDRAVTFVAAVLLIGRVASAACPFCGVVGRSLAERRDAADVVAVGEAAAPAAADADGLLVQRFAIVQALRSDPGDTREVAARVAASVAATAVLFGSRDAARPGGFRWEAIPGDEALLAHVAAAPPVGDPPARRLGWFASRLEHANPAIAEDAFVEFGLAPFAAVREAATAFDGRRLGAWLTEPGIDPRRRGFYGLALGLAAARAADPAEAGRGVAALRAAIAAPADDLRAGFDGLLAGLLVATGGRGLDDLEARGLLAGDTRAGDARHALAALRFAAENLGDTLPRERVAAATARLLANPAVAAEAAIDLARYGEWTAVETVAGLWDTLGRDDPLVRRAVAGYLAACPLEAARRQLDGLRARDPDRLRQALDAAGPR